MTAQVPAVSDEQPIEPPVQPAPALPDRADAPVSEVAERFLRAVVAQVPVELIEELHLFSPLRQGTLETGIAVLAVRVPAVAEPEHPTETVEAQAESDPELPFAGEPEGEAGEAGAGETGVGTTGGGETGVGTTGTAVADEDVVADHVIDDDLGDASIVAEQVVDGESAEVIAAEGDDDEDVSYADELDAEASADEGNEAAAIEVVMEVAPVVKPVRHTVYTARYRYVIKGPERGKWESSIKAEADAPLITVETVVRGVQRRAGEESEIVRYTAAQIAHALRMPLQSATASA